MIYNHREKLFIKEWITCILCYSVDAPTSLNKSTRIGKIDTILPIPHSSLYKLIRQLSTFFVIFKIAGKLRNHTRMVCFFFCTNIKINHTTFMSPIMKLSYLIYSWKLYRNIIEINKIPSIKTNVSNTIPFLLIIFSWISIVTTLILQHS